MVDAEGFVWVMGRTDDIINVAGHRLSTGAMEEVLAAHPDVAECAVVGAPDADWGERVTAVVELRPGATASASDSHSAVRPLASDGICMASPIVVEAIADQKSDLGKAQSAGLRLAANP